MDVKDRVVIKGSLELDYEQLEILLLQNVKKYNSPGLL